MYQNIKDIEEYRKFVDTIDHFHDSIVKEWILKNRSHIDKRGWMHDDFVGIDMRILFQTQEKKCVDIIFEDVHNINCDFYYDLEVDCVFTNDEIIFYFNKYSFIQCKIIKYRLLGLEYLGSKPPRLIDIPIGIILHAIQLNKEWLQCPECKNAIERVLFVDDIAKCPNCDNYIYFNDKNIDNETGTV
jgi:hypothetical protein